MSALVPRSWGIQQNDGGALPVELTGLGYEVRQDRSYRWNRALHPPASGWVIQYTLQGGGRFASSTAKGVPPGNPVVVGPGELFFTAPGMDYEYTWAGREAWHFYWIMLKGPAAGDILARAAASLPRGPLLAGTDTAGIAQLMQGLVQRFQEGRVPDRHRLSLLGYEVLLELDVRSRSNRSGSSAASGPDSAATLAEARQWLSSHWKTARSLLLARHFGYHPKYFIQWFRARTGLSPEAFLQEERMRRACTLLEGTGLPIKAIAADLGYREDNHFSRVFRRHCGQSPKAWRHQRQNSQLFDDVVPL